MKKTVLLDISCQNRCIFVLQEISVMFKSHQGTLGISENCKPTADIVSFLLETIPGNFMIRQADNSHSFYFICDNTRQTVSALSESGLFVISVTSFNNETSIGFGLGDTRLHGITVFRTADKTMCRYWADILDFTFFRTFGIPDYFCYDSHFNGVAEFGGIRYYYIHDYLPLNSTMDSTDKKRVRQVRNCIFAFKDGEKPELWAKIFSLCIKEVPELSNILENAVIVPIPASTKKKNICRYAAFCRHLAGMLGVEDGYRTCWFQHDRNEMKGKTVKNILCNMSFNRKYVAGKHVLLIDDVITTGCSLRQMGDKMKELGAVSVTGIFMGRTL